MCYKYARAHQWRLRLKMSQKDTSSSNGFLSPYNIPFRKPLPRSSPTRSKTSATATGTEAELNLTPPQLETRENGPSARTTPQDAPSAVSEATKGLSRKVFTGTGYSGFDWLRLDIPTPKALRRITIEEVQQHASVDDCWIVLQGKVYDITPYIPFHPGGKYQILRAKGKDATELFMKTHPWINPEPLLRKCWIGFLIR